MKNLERLSRRGPLRLWTVALIFATACSGVVAVDPPIDAADAGISDAGAPHDAAGDAPVEPAKDASACTDPEVCSRVVDHSGCVGATSVGEFCDFVATPCVVHPPDCGKVSSIVGLSFKLADCGNGLSFCVFGGTTVVSATTLEALCQAHDAIGQPVDCASD
jgi:hypothetical protein